MDTKDNMVIAGQQQQQEQQQPKKEKTCIILHKISIKLAAEISETQINIAPHDVNINIII